MTKEQLKTHVEHIVEDNAQQALLHVTDKVWAVLKDDNEYDRLLKLYHEVKNDDASMDRFLNASGIDQDIAYMIMEFFHVHE